jgi:hypothetical protein
MASLSGGTSPLSFCVGVPVLVVEAIVLVLGAEGETETDRCDREDAHNGKPKKRNRIILIFVCEIIEGCCSIGACYDSLRRNKQQQQLK